MRSVLFFLFFFTAIFRVQSQVDSILHQGKYHYVYPHDAPEIYVGNGFFEGIHFKQIRETDSISGKKSVKIVPFPDNEHPVSQYEQGNYNPAHVRTTPFLYYDEMLGMHQDIAPVLEPIPNGNYLQYFKQIPYLHGDTLKYFYNQVAAVFSIKNNLPEGSACWFSTSGDSIKFGSYSNGLKQGFWTLLTYSKSALNEQQANGANTKPIKRKLTSFSKTNFVDGVEEGLETTMYIQNQKEVISTSTFLHGRKTGACTQSENGRLVAKGFLTDNLPSGEWFYYGPKQQKSSKKQTNQVINEKSEMILLRHYKLTTDFKPGKSTIIRGYIYESDRDSINMYFGNIKLPKSGTSDREFPFLKGINEYGGFQTQSFGNFYQVQATIPTNGYAVGEYIQGYQLDEPVMYIRYENGVLLSSKFERQDIIDSVGYEFLVEGIYEEYYPNGQLKFKFEVKDGILVKEEPIFWDNGKIASEITYDKNTNRYAEKLYTYHGELVLQKVYDAKGKFIRTEINKFKRSQNVLELNGKTYHRNGNRFYYNNPNYFNNPVSEITIISEVLNPEDSTNIQLTTFDPVSRTYYSKIRFDDGVSYSEATYTFDSLYKQYSGIRKDVLGDLVCQQPVQGEINMLGLEAIKFRNRQQHLNYFQPFNVKFDSACQWKQNDIPFTGKLELNFDCNEFHVKSGKHKIEINLTQNQQFNAIFFNLLADMGSAISEHVERPDTLKKQAVQVIGVFKNGYPNGEWQSVNAQKEKTIKCTLEKGKIIGACYRKMYPKILPTGDIQKDFMIPKTTAYFEYPDEPIYYLASFTNRKNEVLDGLQYEFNWKGDTTSILNYTAGIKTGNARTFNFISGNYTYSLYQDDSLAGKQFSLNKAGDTTQLCFFERGQLHGKWMMQTDTSYEEKNYQNGKLNGKQFIFWIGKNNSKQLVLEATYEKNTLNGVATVYDQEGILRQRGNFKNGTHCDFFEEYDSLGILTKKTILQDSLVIRQEIWKNGKLNHFYTLQGKDSLRFQANGFNSSTVNAKPLYHYVRPKLGFRKHVYLPNDTCYFTKVFENGNFQMEGLIHNKYKMGIWNYYNSKGEPSYRIHYFDSTIVLPDSNSFRSRGIYEHLDSLGNLIAKSYIIDQRSEFDCTHDEHYEIRTFYTFWEKNASVGRMNGLVKNYYDNGILQSEGTMKNGLPEGIWKYYDPFGGLNQVGQFHSGMKEGRWLTGDLGKMAYIGDICLNPDQADLEKLSSQQEKVFQIWVEYFQQGNWIQGKQYTVDKN